MEDFDYFITPFSRDFIYYFRGNYYQIGTVFYRCDIDEIEDNFLKNLRKEDIKQDTERKEIYQKLLDGKIFINDSTVFFVDDRFWYFKVKIREIHDDILFEVLYNLFVEQENVSKEVLEFIKSHTLPCK